MPRVIGIDPGTISLDLFGLDDGRVWLDLSLPTASTLTDPSTLLAQLKSHGPVDLIAGPSGYGLPLVSAADLTETDLKLAYLARDHETGGIGGLRRLARLLAEHQMPVVFTPGVIHLPTVPSYRKLNRVDLGTADKLATAVLGIWDQAHRLGGKADHATLAATSFILLELGGAFTAAVAVSAGKVVDGIGGTSGPIGWQSSGAWDGEVAFLAGSVEKEHLFRGGASGNPDGLKAYVEGACKAALALTASVPEPREVLLSGRQARDPAIGQALARRLGDIGPVRLMSGLAQVAKEGAQGAALMADGLAGGSAAALVEAMELRRATGTALDYLTVISPERARQRLGI